MTNGVAWLKWLVYALAESTGQVFEEDQKRRCVAQAAWTARPTCRFCFSQNPPMISQAKQRLMVRRKELNITEHSIMQCFQMVCCSEPIHLACYLDYNRHWYGRDKKEEWCCPLCETPACFNVYQGNFHLGTQHNVPNIISPEGHNDLFLQWKSHKLPDTVPLFR